MQNPEIDEVIKGLNRFALELYRELASESGNLFLSPYSIASALSMTMAGARGSTREQATRTLHLEFHREALHKTIGDLQAHLTAGDTLGSTLAIANGLWVQTGHPLLPDFSRTIEEIYRATVGAVDFRNGDSAAICEEINNWVAARTAGKISMVLRPEMVESLTGLILINAIYFKGKWKCPFEATDTVRAKFMANARNSIDVAMMYQTPRKCRYADAGTVQLLELPYDSSDLAMVILLPKEIEGIVRLEESLTIAILEQMLRSLNSIPNKVKLHLPRFKFESEFELSETLPRMGMVDAFRYPAADFSGIDGGTELFISRVIHKAFVDVNEEGTEAAAATALTMYGASGVGMPAEPIVFRADHPFLFLIRDARTQSILFMGRVSKPERWSHRPTGWLAWLAAFANRRPR